MPILCFTIVKKNTYPWFRSIWLKTTLCGIALLSLIIGIITGAPFEYLIGQICLALSVYFSLWLLSDRPLLNPIQAVIPLFYWWFGVGPTIIAFYKVLLDFTDDAIYAQVSGMEGLWIVTLGLPLYAFIARNILKKFKKINYTKNFLTPSGINYRTITLIIFLAIGGLSKIMIFILEEMGISGIEQTHFLGGTITHIWWIGLIVMIGGIFTFANSAIISSIIQSGKYIKKSIKLLGIVLLFTLIVSAITSGWKGAFITPGIYLIASYVSQKQRLPWLWIIIGIISYLFLVEPFVTAGRHIAEMAKIKTSEERSIIYRDLLFDRFWLEERSWEDIKIESPFRGIYQLAGEVTRRNSFFYGEWQGFTIQWGLLAIIPRFIFPEKPMLNIGNFFALTIGADLGMVSTHDFITNIAIPIPFEIIGNFGWLAGLLSFGLIGAFWSIICSLLLTPARLSNHPFTPLLIGLTLRFEAPIGHFLAYLRDLIIPLIIIFLIRIIPGKRL